VNLEQSYIPRRIRALGVDDICGWRMKLYGLSREDNGPDPILLDRARDCARSILPAPAVMETRYGVGFIGAHQGRGSSLVFVAWWERENELHHHVWITGQNSFDELEYVTPVGLAACVWDLVVICHERQAWIDAVLAPAVPDTGRYLELVIEGRF
jgi:hypothetical protein